MKKSTTKGQSSAAAKPADNQCPSEKESLKPAQLHEGSSWHDIPHNNDNLNLHSPPVKATGSRKSVLVGINYKGQKGELRGCVNDVERVQWFLKENGFPQDHDQILLTDDGKDEEIPAKLDKPCHVIPTKKNIMKALKWIVADAKQGDSLFFHFSGHGVNIKDLDGDEEDGYDEALVPVDYRRAGVILDDTLSALLCHHLPPGVRLTVLMDCCHSGSGLDLPFTFVGTEENVKAAKSKLKNFKKNDDITKKKKEPRNKGPFKKNRLAAKESADEEHKEHITDLHPDRLANEDHVSDGQVVKISGCQDDQTSADVSSCKNFDLPPDIEGGAGGACTGAFLQAMAAHEKLTYIELIEEVRKCLAEKKFKQIPNLSSTMAFDLGADFHI